MDFIIRSFDFNFVTLDFLKTFTLFYFINLLGLWFHRVLQTLWVPLGYDVLLGTSLHCDRLSPVLALFAFNLCYTKTVCFLFFFPFLILNPLPSIYLSIYLWKRLFLTIVISLESFSLSLPLIIYLSIKMFISYYCYLSAFLLSFYLSLSISFEISISLSILKYLPLCLFWSIYLSIYQWNMCLF